MTKNWVEELVAEYYRLHGYLVVTNLDLPMPKTERRKVKGHSDIDVLAIREDAVEHIECQTWWGPSKRDENTQFQRLRERFQRAQDVMFTRYGFLKNLLRVPPITTKIFVTSGKPKRRPPNKERKSPWYRLKALCERENIQLIEINTIVKETIEKLRDKYPVGIVGKEESEITRFLIHLIHNNFLK